MAHVHLSSADHHRADALLDQVAGLLDLLGDALCREGAVKFSDDVDFEPI